ncbi:hypothetical protein FDB55_17655 [Clostridium botulinum]|uniref:hypothetical protein n=1 Tax=Clostridium botulinum TaxID=1491 RepID=UPI0007747F07|nr:hypothetical protein [Clostridium botulinum]MCS6110410.1 hypothetical protein [Clostridium botulinum]NFE13790.1 hypothetical protein [Clostridium botulinum]NFG39435.1 hypothetical protein [Clostridium botulinum]NFL43677.1 hypothetical protein [Clostridium botulinum]NFN14837.1 hypothetical protein [Clostridium botulinum]
MKPMCPDCGNELVFHQVARACKSTKINKDGSLSKRSKFIINGEDDDICYLHCDKCDFNYSLTYVGFKEDSIDEFDEWFWKE